MRRELIAIAVGALSGLVIGGLFACGASWTYAALAAVALGAPAGAASAFVADRVLLAAVPGERVTRWLPVLFAAALVGSAPALLGSPLGLFTGPLLLVAVAAWLRWRWERVDMAA